MSDPVSENEGAKDTACTLSNMQSNTHAETRERKSGTDQL
jgi:hypothetical protein